jgi:hypothetical protein
MKAAKERASKTHKTAGRQNKTPEGGRTRFEKQERGNETASWDQPESGTRRPSEERNSSAN